MRSTSTGSTATIPSDSRRATTRTVTARWSSSSRRPHDRLCDRLRDPAVRPAYAFIGDLTWQIDGIRRRVERPWLLSKLADSDPDQLRQDLLRIDRPGRPDADRPAHDLASYDGIPLLTPERRRTPPEDVRFPDAEPNSHRCPRPRPNPHRLRDHLAPAPGGAAHAHGDRRSSRKYGLSLRDYIVLSALEKTAGLTQGELGKSLGWTRPLS